MRFYCSMFLLLLSLSLEAQVRISDRELPQMGDTSLFFVDYLPQNINPGQSGGNQRWNFMTLQSPFIRGAQWEDGSKAAGSKQFRKAQLSIRKFQDQEAYYAFGKNGLMLLGYRGVDPFGLGIKNTYTFQEPITEERQDLRFGDRQSSKTKLVSTCTLEDLPQNVRDLLPITPDSIRLIMVSQRKDEVDGWGTLLMPGGFFEVLREKRSEARSLKMETKLGSMPWQDITNLLNDNDIFGNHVFISYHFYEESFPEAILKVFMKADNQGVDKVVYRAHLMEQKVQSVDDISPGVYAYPNPAIVNIRFEFVNLDPGKYYLSILNVLGGEVWTKEYFIQNDLTEKVDVSFLKKGTYVYALKDSSGKTLTTKRIVIIRP